MENIVEKEEVKAPYMPELPAGSHLFDTDYIVDSFYTCGGMNSDIYLVHDQSDPKTKLIAKIVWKKLVGTDNEQWARVCNEATSSLRVRNKPNLVQTFNVYKIDGENPCICFVMEYFGEKSLRDYLNDKGCLIPKTALNLFLKILNGVKSLHNFTHQIIHRDLKPENILLSDDLSDVAIIDFGISTVVKRSIVNTNPNKKDNVADGQSLYGSAGYIIPDALKEYGAKKNFDDRVITVQYDFFSLGVILYEMIIGKMPFDSEGLTSKHKICRLPLTYDMLNISSNPSIPVALENIIFRCIASKPEDIKYRYNSIEEIISDVKNVIPLLNKDDGNTKLLKPTEKRMYQKAKQFSIDSMISRQKPYKQTWCCLLIVCLSIALLVACIVVFFVL